jgi:hypothetical protein
VYLNRFLGILYGIARKDFILNDLFSGGRNPGKILKFTPIVFYIRCNDVTQTQTESGREILQMQAN